MPEQDANGQVNPVAAEFTRTPEEEAEIRSELEQDLAMLLRGEVPRKGLVATLHNFGEERFVDALPEIRKYIISTDERLRYIALHVLTQHYQLADYARIAIDMMKNDPDEDCRLMAISGLLSLRSNTSDLYALRELAALVNNEKEDRFLRERAYRAMRGIVAYDMDEQERLAVGPFDLNKDVDWNFVNTYR